MIRLPTEVGPHQGKKEELPPPEALFQFLLNPASYPHRPKKITLIQTHASSVFLSGPWVYKVKKPVNFGFLDYSTLDKRWIACEREIQLNRRLCPNVYREVVSIRSQKGRLHFGNEGTVVEYAVKMKRLSERYFFDRLVEEGKATRDDISRITHRLAQFYREQHPTPEIEQWGTVKRLRISTRENFRQTERFIGLTIGRAEFEALKHYTDVFFRAHEKLFRSRVRDRWIRDCHGDLHLDHIHLTPRSLEIYDCIEFNDRFRYVDVASDLAFLTMDLRFRDRPDLANILSRGMSKALQDSGLEKLLPFYECYRAYVRGKVESLHSLSPEAPPAEQAGFIRRAQRYFSRALEHAITRDRPTVLVMMGQIGSGKSTLARCLSEALGWPSVSSDHVRKEQAGFPLYQRTPAEARAALYSKSSTARAYRALQAAAREAVRGGRSLVLDATFGRATDRAALKRALRAGDGACLFIEVRASRSITQRRLKARDSATREISDARWEDFEKLSHRYEAPVELHRNELIRLDSGKEPQAVLTGLLKQLAERSARGS